MKKTAYKQKGGNPILQALPSLTQLAIPAGLTLASHLAHQYLEPIKQEQTGGNPFLLKAVADLAVPFGLTAGAHWLSSMKTSPSQSEEQNEQSGGNRIIPSPVMFQHPLMLTWMQDNQVTSLTPETMVPVALLLKLYFLYVGMDVKRNTNIYQRLIGIVDQEDLDTYLKSRKITHLTPNTSMPFALIMGPDVFKFYVNGM